MVGGKEVLKEGNIGGVAADGHLDDVLHFKQAVSGQGLQLANPRQVERHAGLPNVPPLSSGRVSKPRAAWSRRPSPWYSPRATGTTLLRGTRRGRQLQQLVGQPLRQVPEGEGARTGGTEQRAIR
jgi:hypothetical protein